MRTFGLFAVLWCMVGALAQSAKAEAPAEAVAQVAADDTKAVAQAKAEADAKAADDARAAAQVKTEADAGAEEAKARAEQEAKGRALSDARAEEEAKGRALSDARAEEEAKGRALSDARAEEEAKVRNAAAARAEIVNAAAAEIRAAEEAKAPAAAEANAAAPKPATTDYPEFNHGDTKPKDGIDWVQAITVSEPAYRADVQGKVTVTFRAANMVNAKASCWQQPTTDNPSPWGHDVDVAPDIKLDADGNGSFIFPADNFPNGPLTLRIYAKDNGKNQDQCQVQLYNKGGVAWNQGVPKTDPPAAKGMKLAFTDDFDGPLSISRDGKDAKYMSHKTGGGDFSGWPFSDNAGDNNPFGQVGTYLRIRASKGPGNEKGSSGIISSAREDHTGFFAGAPCYFECRFLAQSAPGTWPAFWLLNKGCLDKTTKGTDELDIVEAYGGLGKGNPNFPGYGINTHYWGQTDPDGKPIKHPNTAVSVMDLGGKSTWSTTFHTYGVKITKTDTVYYFDDIEVFRHPAGEISKSDPFWFLINYAIGGISGWKIDLARYGNASDMYVDYVRVYEGEK